MSFRLVIPFTSLNMPFTSFRLVRPPYLAGLALHERLSLGQEVAEEKGVV
jgi:hypothetical protein